MWNKIKENAELTISGILILLLVSCIDPFEALMPSGWNRTLVVLLVTLYAFYAGIVFRERSKDERERLHLALAERAGFLVGTGLLVLFIILNLFGAAPEKALVFVLAGMAFTKLIVLLVVRHRN